MACCRMISIPLSRIYCRSFSVSLNLDLNLDFLRDSKVWGFWLFSNIYGMIMKVFYSLHIFSAILIAFCFRGASG